MPTWKDALASFSIAAIFIFALVWVPFSIESRRLAEIEEHEAAEQVGAVGSVPRSGHWPAVMHAFRSDHPVCMFHQCLTPDHRVNIHHAIPFSWANKAGHPWLELCPENLITGCGDHHIHVFHCGNFQKFNLDVRHDAEVGKYNSRGISEWPGNEEMLRFLVWSLGPPSESRPDTLPLPLVVTDPHQAWSNWKSR